MEEFLLYFHVLCLTHPGYRHPGNVRLYLDYNRYFDALSVELYDDDSELQATVESAVTAWVTTQLTQEDKYLLEQLTIGDSYTQDNKSLKSV